MKFAILGLGGIAVKMAETILRMEDVELYAVSSRDAEKRVDSLFPLCT